MAEELKCGLDDVCNKKPSETHNAAYISMYVAKIKKEHPHIDLTSTSLFYWCTQCAGFHILEVKL